MTAGPLAPELEGLAVAHAVYGSGGGYRPGLAANLRAAVWLLTTRRADVWHFLFAPNPRTSQVGRHLRALRGVPTVQTIASPPRSFQNPGRLLFGDKIVAQSRWTKDQFEAAFRQERLLPPPIEVIPPPAPSVVVPERADQVEALLRLGLDPARPLFLYPGDLEVSQGADHAVAFSEALRPQLAQAQVVIAYRAKTPHADARAEALRRQADPARVTIAREVPEFLRLVAAATAVLFPVDDLYGKVDLPIVLLEALGLGTPVLALDRGPLRELEGALHLPWDHDAWVAAAVRVCREPGFREHLTLAGKRAASTRFSAAQVAASYEAIYRSLL